MQRNAARRDQEHFKKAFFEILDVQRSEGGIDRAIAQFSLKFSDLEGEVKQRFDEFLVHKSKGAAKAKDVVDRVEKMHGKNPAKLRQFLESYEKEKHLYPIGTKERIQKLLHPPGKHDQTWQTILARNKGPEGFLRSINELRELHGKAHKDDKPALARLHQRYIE